jgi:hypothetical protein
MKKIIFVFATNGNIKNTGIESVANGLACSFEQKVYFYSTTKNDADIPIFNIIDFIPSQLEIVLFSHLEYNKLLYDIKKIQPKIVYVGDWILNYRISLFRWKPSVKNFLKIFLSYYRVFRVFFELRNCNLLYVNKIDMLKSKKFGFVNSIYLPLGHSHIPTDSPLEETSYDSKLIAFSGNFDYEPNVSASKLLINFINNYNNYKLLLIGKSAYKFANIQIPNLEIYSDVESIVQILKLKKPIYVAPVFFGAGSKNKILDAAASRIPIITTIECLDSEFYFKLKKDFYILEESKNFNKQLNELLLKVHKENWNDNEIYDLIVRQRYWPVISSKFRIILNDLNSKILVENSFSV